MKMNRIIRFFSVTCVLGALAVTLAGCGNGAETKEEIARRHDLIMRRNLTHIQDEIDTMLMLDKPSMTTDRLIRP